MNASGRGVNPLGGTLRFVRSDPVRAAILRYFLPLAAAAGLFVDVLSAAPSERLHRVLLLSLIGLVYLSLRSAELIGRRIENSLQESEERYAVLVNSLKGHAVLLLDPVGRILTWNAGAEGILGYGAAEVLGDSVSRFYPPPERENGKMRHTFEEAALRGSHEEQGERVRKDGAHFWAETVTTPLIDGKNALTGFSQVLRDITLRKKNQDSVTASLREKETLLKEIHHRVKNNLQMISSLLHLQSEDIRDPALLSLFLESQNRVRSMAIIHECLYQSPDLARMDFSDYVGKLTDSLLRSYSVSPGRILLRLEVDKAPLNLDIAIPCGLIITELVSNALKYAYPPDGGGPLLVKFRVLPGNRYELIVSDEGVGLKGPVDLESTGSLGLRLVHMLTEQLRGRIKMQNGTGATFIIHFQEPDGRS